MIYKHIQKLLHGLKTQKLCRKDQAHKTEQKRPSRLVENQKTQGSAREGLCLATAIDAGRPVLDVWAAGQSVAAC